MSVQVIHVESVQTKNGGICPFNSATRVEWLVKNIAFKHPQNDTFKLFVTDFIVSKSSRQVLAHPSHNSDFFHSPFESRNSEHIIILQSKDSEDLIHLKENLHRSREYSINLLFSSLIFFLLRKNYGNYYSVQRKHTPTETRIFHRNI